MGAEIPRYRREKLRRCVVGESRSQCQYQYPIAIDSDEQNLPFVLDDLAEAVKHAIVVLCACDGGAGLKLTAVRRKVLVNAGGRRVRLRSGYTYTRVLTTSNGYLSVVHCQFHLILVR